MADLGAIGTRARGRPYYVTTDRRPQKNDRLRVYMRTRYVTGTFIRDKVELRTPGRYRFVPFYLNTNVAIDPCNGLVAGTTLHDGNPAPFKPVHLFHRPNIIRVRSTLSDASGNFSFPYVAMNTSYFVMSLDTTIGPPTFNASIADYITPSALN